MMMMMMMMMSCLFICLFIHNGTMFLVASAVTVGNIIHLLSVEFH